MNPRLDKEQSKHISHLLREDALLERHVHKCSWTRRYVLSAAKLVGQAFERNMRWWSLKIQEHKIKGYLMFGIVVY